MDQYLDTAAPGEAEEIQVPREVADRAWEAIKKSLPEVESLIGKRVAVKAKDGQIFRGEFKSYSVAAIQLAGVVDVDRTTGMMSKGSTNIPYDQIDTIFYEGKVE